MNIEAIIREEAARAGVPVEIALRVAWIESSWNPAARGPAGEIGVMQLLPSTAEELGINPFDVRQNIRGGIEYLRRMYRQFGRWDLAVAAYNVGPGNVKRGLLPTDYMAKVFGNGPLMPHPTFKIDVVSTPIEAPWWVLAVLAAALLSMATEG